MNGEKKHIPADPEEARFAAEFEERLKEVVARADGENPARPYLYKATISFAVVTRSGATVWADHKFDDWLAPEALDARLCQTVWEGDEPSYSLTKDKQNRPVLLTYAPASVAKRWSSLNAQLEEQIETPNTVAVAVLSLSHLADEVEFAARALGLSNLEARVSAALFVHGSKKRAAAHAGVTYHTARKAVSEAMKTAGVSRQTSLVRKLAQLAAVNLPPREASEQILIDVFGLKQHDAKLVHLLCEGYSRNDAARISGLSTSVAKDRFAHIFQHLEIETATDLPQLVMGAFAAAVLVHEAPPPLQPGRQARAPLKLIRSPEGRVIAVNDYGPRNAQPVLIAHSSLTTRHPFLKLVRALQAAGCRPFTIDRPGFGLTDDLEELTDRFATGVADVVTVCDALDFGKIHVISRGGAFHVLALARYAPERIDRVVVINPDLLQHDCSNRKGYLGVVRHVFDRYPDSIERVVKWISSQLSRKRMETVIRAGIGDAPADLESFSDAQNFEDYIRSITAFWTGRLSGFIREQRGYVLQTQVEGLEDARNWTVLLGGSDPIHDVEEIKSFWKKKLPGARMRTLPDAGRFISLSHTSEVVSSLRP